MERHCKHTNDIGSPILEAAPRLEKDSVRERFRKLGFRN